MTGLMAQIKLRLHSTLLLCCVSLLPAIAPAAEPDAADEFQIKAAYLYNFASLAHWPAPEPAMLTLCVYGPDPFGDLLDNTLRGKTAGGRALTLVRTNAVDELGSCQIVFVSAAVISNLPRVLDTLTGRSVLTVADSPGATAAGIMLNMTPQTDRIGFEVNLRVARDHGITLPFQLLRLATGVIN